MEAVPASIKLLVIDIDGTLLNPEGKITPRTLAAVQAAQQAGIVVTLATARRYGNTMQIAKELGLENPLILYDGALIVPYPATTILYRHSLSALVAQQAVNLMVQHQIQPVVHPIPVLIEGGLVEELWTSLEELDNLWIAAYLAAYPEQMRRLPFEELCVGHPDPLRVVCFTSEEAIEALIPEVSALVGCSWNTIKRGNYGSAELTIMVTGCSKASGVATLADQLGIPIQQVMALGDNNNDREMLQAVGWGVAMGQAPAAVKAVAHAITANNAEDGAALAIERYALRSALSAPSNSFRRTTCL